MTEAKAAPPPELLNPRLEALAESLQAACKKVEPDFMQLGKELQSVYMDVSQLTRNTLETVKKISGEEEQSVLVGVDRLARHSLERIQQSREQVAARLQLIHAVVEDLKHLSRSCPAVEKIAKTLNVVGLSINIESSASEEAQSMFSVLSRDTKELAQTILGIGEDIQEQCESTRKDLSTAHQQMSERFKRLCTLTEDGEATLRSAVEEIEKLMTGSLKAMEQAGSSSRDISRRVGEIVVGIQFHDSMSQRIEHVQKALHDAMDLCSNGGPTENPSNPSAPRWGKAHSILYLQSAHLRQVVSEIDTVYQTNLQAFDEIQSKAANLAHTLATFGADSEGSLEERGASEDPFASLKNAMNQLDSILNRGQNLHDQTRDTAHQASETVDRLSENIAKVRKISLETHLKALNAIIKTEHLGEKGRTLEVLAQEMKRLSDQAGEFVTQVEAILQSVASSAKQLRPRASSTKGSDSERAAPRMAGTAARDITKAYEEFQEESSQASRKVEALKQAIARTREGLRFLMELRNELDQESDGLEELKDVLSPWAEDGEDYSPEEARDLADRYTMEQEREIHERFVRSRKDSGASIPIKAKEETASASDDVELFDDNVELFGDSGPSPAGAEPPAQPAAVDDDVELFDDNVELFGDSGETAAEEEKARASKGNLEAEKPKEEDEDFGDNVELF